MLASSGVYSMISICKHFVPSQARVEHRDSASLLSVDEAEHHVVSEDSTSMSIVTAVVPLTQENGAKKTKQKPDEAAEDCAGLFVSRVGSRNASRRIRKWNDGTWTLFNALIIVSS
jgi:hypothetical protein